MTVTRSAKHVILGLSGSWHDSAAALLVGDTIVGGLEEERMTRAKHDSAQFPVNAILRLLAEAALRWDDVNHVAIGWDYPFYVSAGSNSPCSRFFDALDCDYARRNRIEPNRVTRRMIPERSNARFRMTAVQEFLNTMGWLSRSTHRPCVTYVRHHLAHAASAYYACGLPEPVLVVVLDGSGESETTTVWIGRDRALNRVMALHIPHSLGWVYSSITEYLGFRPESTEGEVMGLAAYGAPRSAVEDNRVSELKRFMNDYVAVNRNNGAFRVNSEFLYFGHRPPGRTRVTDAMLARLQSIVAPAIKPGAQLDPASEQDRPLANLAYVLQEKIEEAILNLAHHFLNRDPRTRGVQSVALAGGIALNIQANGKLISEGLVKPDRLFVQPAAGDSGTALGAALIVTSDVYGHDPRFHMIQTDYGPSYSDENIAGVLKSFGLVQGIDYEDLLSYENVARVVADLLAGDSVVAWFQGRSEFGPRALGHRSILLNVLDPRANRTANRIKDRQWWRPSAIAVMAESASDYIEGMEPGVNAHCMTMAFPVTAAGRRQLVAGLHEFDSSTRPQLVTRQTDPLFWQVLYHLGTRTGVPAVLNTSFNQNEPIVESPEEALNTYAYMQGVDALSIGRYLVTSRQRIMPTVRSLCREPTTHCLVNDALADETPGAWDRVVESMMDWGTGCVQIIFGFRGLDANMERYHYPLAKELLFGRARESLRRHLTQMVCDRAVRMNATEVAVGATHDKYDLVIFRLFAESLAEWQRNVNRRCCFAVIPLPTREHSRL